MAKGDIYYAHEKFIVAVHELATGEGTLSERLRHGFVSKTWTAVSVADLPEEAHEDFAALQKIRSEDLDDPKTAKRAAQLICDIDGRITNALIPLRPTPR